jgi:hypothetical protein
VTIQVALDLSIGHVITASIKVATGVAGVVILDALCGVDLGIVSWFIIATPFVVTSLATAIALGLDIENKTQTKVKEAFSMSPGETEGEDKPVDSLAEQEPVDYPFSTSSPL